jgi:subtilisin family serine protease
MRILTIVALIAGLPLAAMAASGAQQSDAHQRAKAALEAQRDGAPLVHAPGTLLVRFQSTLPESSRASIRSLVAGQLIDRLPIVDGLEHLEVAIPVDQAIKALQALPFVVYAEPDFVVHTSTTPNDQYFNLLWGMRNTGQTVNSDPGTAGADINAPGAWSGNYSFPTGDSNFVIAVIDTGIQRTHPDLAANMWINAGEIPGNGIDDDGNGYIDDVYGWNFYDNNNNPDDSGGHGTHVAGTIGAVGNNSIGVVGVNWQCQLMALKFIGRRGGYTSDAIRALNYAVANGAKVSNNSWGGGAYSQALDDSINSAGIAGHLFVAAAGNDSRNSDATPSYPGSYTLDNIISVAATNNDDGLASFSNYGATSVDIGAPGVMIASTYKGSGYVYMDGTSMASPHVAGVAALVWSYQPALTLSEVRTRILSTARPVPSLAGKAVTGGVVNAHAAMTNTPFPQPPPVLAIPAGPGNVTGTNLGGGQARVNWSDNSNNEDGFQLECQRRQGNTWRDTAIIGSASANSTSYIDAPGAGTFRYRVRSFNSAGASNWSAWSSSVTVN